MHTKLVEGQIIFYYPYSALFEDVQHQSAFMCKNIVAKEGGDLSERYAITDDERGMFELCLRETVPDVHDIISVLTHGIDDAIYVKISGTDFIALDPEALSPSPAIISTTEDYVVFRTVDNLAYNPNAVALVDAALQSTLEQGVLSNFYTRVIHPDLTKMASGMFVGQGGALAQRIIPLRKKSVL